MMNGMKLNGQMILDLVTSYVDAINWGAVPNIQQAWIYICKNECQKALDESLRNFEVKFRHEFEEQFPMFDEDLYLLYIQN